MEDGNNGRFPRITRKADDEDDHEHRENENDITLNGYQGKFVFSGRSDGPKGQDSIAQG
jgi:hypothetical protein